VTTDTGGLSLAGLAALFQLVVLSMLLERSLAFLFELKFSPPDAGVSGKWLRKKQRDDSQDPLVGDCLGSFFKGIVTYAAAVGLCRGFDFDVYRPIMHADLGGKASAGASWPDILLTAAVVAGGSAGAIKLFQDVLGFSKTARDAAKDAREAEAQARLSRAQTEKAEAELALQRVQQQAELAKIARIRAAQPWSLKVPPTPKDVVAIKRL
jgi:hypothetical protein